MNFNETDEYSKDFKRLSKKYRSLVDDFIEFKKIVSEMPCGVGRHFTIIHSQEEIKVIKARFFCRYLRGSSLRVIYAYKEVDNCIEFIQLYFKGEQENEDRDRIKKYLN